MAITFICDCGQEIVAADDAAGSYMQCGQCGAWQKVPQARGPVAPHREATEQPTHSPAQGFDYQGADPYRQPPQPAQPYAQQGAYPPYQPYQPYYTPQPYYAPTYPGYYPMSIPRPAPSGNAPVILGVLGIGLHLMDCMMTFVSAGACLVLSIIALIIGIVQARKHSEPRVVLNGRLGAILGFVGLVGGVILMIISIGNLQNLFP